MWKSQDKRHEKQTETKHYGTRISVIESLEEGFYLSEWHHTEKKKEWTDPCRESVWPTLDIAKHVGEAHTVPDMAKVLEEAHLLSTPIDVFIQRVRNGWSPSIACFTPLNVQPTSIKYPS